MQITKAIETLFKRYLPSPFTIAVLLTLLTIALATLFTKPETSSTGAHFIQVLSYWEDGIWNSSLLVFAYQMMLILVLGHGKLTPEFKQDLQIWYNKNKGQNTVDDLLKLV